MDATLKAFLESGRALVADTKTPRKLPPKDQKVSKAEVLTGKAPDDSDPYRVFVKKTVTEKPKRKDVVEAFKRFIVAEEDDI